MHRLTPLRGIWDTSLHASGIRLRNAQDWGAAGSLPSSRLREVMERSEPAPTGTASLDQPPLARS